MDINAYYSGNDREPQDEGKPPSPAVLKTISSQTHSARYASQNHKQIGEEELFYPNHDAPRSKQSGDRPWCIGPPEDSELAAVGVFHAPDGLIRHRPTPMTLLTRWLAKSVIAVILRVFVMI